MIVAVLFLLAAAVALLANLNVGPLSERAQVIVTFVVVLGAVLLITVLAKSWQAYP